MADSLAHRWCAAGLFTDEQPYLRGFGVGAVVANHREEDRCAGEESVELSTKPANRPGQLAQFKGFPYYGRMNVTLSLEDKLVKKVRKIAVERDTTLTGMVRAYLKDVAAEDAAPGRKRREREALDLTFQQVRLKVGMQTWTRADLHARS
jgi:hypothetical protein